MKKLLLFLLLGPMLPASSAAYSTVTTANAYMVENTSGTDSSGNTCYDFQTRPSCRSFITGLVVSSSTFANLFNSTNTWTGTNTFNNNVNVNGVFLVNGQGVASLASTQTWTGGNTFTSPSGVTVSSLNFVSTSLGGIKGTTTNDNAPSGMYGEYISSVAAGTAGASSGQFGNIAQINLTPGDWEVTGMVSSNVTFVTITGNSGISLSQFSGNTNTDLVSGDNFLALSQGNTGQVAVTVQGVIPTWRVSTASNTTVYVKAQLTYSGGSPVFQGRISARRMR